MIFCHFSNQNRPQADNQLKTSPLRLNQLGMTLLEIMIVLMIIGGIAAMVGVNVVGQMGKANIRQTKITIDSVSKALEIYYTDCSSYPTTEEGLAALMEKTPSCDSWGPDPYWNPRVGIPKDAWNTEIIYEQDGSRYVLISLGADKREGGEGADADISSDD